MVGEEAFEGCDSLLKVAGKLEIVKFRAFSGCCCLTGLDLSKCVQIGEMAFAGC
jgi:hypothetical protein